jgi:NAD(P)-dependent dehydrogenase (short-subunit alcohol dehydrogenase family)
MACFITAETTVMATIALTGGATGIGRAIRDLLEAGGHRLLVIDLKNADIEAALSSSAGRKAAIDGVLAGAPDGLDALITCAGVGSHVADSALIASVNFYGSVELIEGLRPALEKRNGCVVLISSNSAPQCQSTELIDAFLQADEARAREVASGLRGHDVYSGSKLALARWMRHQTPDYAAAGIRLNAVAPGYIETPMTAVVAENPEYGESIAAFKASIPLGRAGEPSDIANVVDFLISPKAAFVCGSVLFADGGHDAKFRPDAV